MLHLEIQPELESQLTAEARCLGISTEEYVEQIIVSRFPEDDEGLREGLEDIAAGRTRPAREVFAELHERHGIRG